jgi:hypothetical protein
MKSFIIIISGIFILTGFIIYNQNNNHIIPKKKNSTPIYKKFEFHGVLNQDMILAFKPSIMGDNDIILRDGIPYYRGVLSTRLNDTGYSETESYLTHDYSFLAIDYCEYNDNDELIYQSISKYDYPSRSLFTKYIINDLIIKG